MRLLRWGLAGEIMTESAYLTEIVAAFLYVLVGAPLLRLARRTRDVAARLIGTTFILWGYSYLLYNFPLALNAETLLEPFFFAGRIFYDAGVLTIGVFTLRVFRAEEPWARSLVLATFACLAAGVIGSAAVGDWEGVHLLTNPWFWVEWFGMGLPLGWVGIEGLCEYVRARRRMALGLCDPLICNRFLLWGLTGFLLLSSNFALIPQYIEYERESLFSSAMDLMLGTFEYLTIGLIWLVFFPPRWYRHCLGGAARPAAAESAV